MRLGNRRFLALGVLGVGLALTLSGCSVHAAVNSSNAQAVSIGQQAVGFTPSDSSSTSPSGSSSSSSLTAGCPDSLKQGLTAGLPASDALVLLNPTVTGGVMSEPNLTEGYVASCAFGIASSGTTVDELYFLGMPSASQDVIAGRVVNDGFVPGTISSVTDGTEQIFTKGTTRIELAHLTVDGVSVLLVAG